MHWQLEERIISPTSSRILFTLACLTEYADVRVQSVAARFENVDADNVMI